MNLREDYRNLIPIMKWMTSSMGKYFRLVKCKLLANMSLSAKRENEVAAKKLF